jgi:hypothetical protein
MDRFRLLRFLVVLGLSLSANAGGAQPPKPKESISNDLKMVLRPASGSNRFRAGEEIRLQLEFSSGAPGKYLAPCAMFYTSHFGFPHCRFFNRWSIEISPVEG